MTRTLSQTSLRSIVLAAAMVASACTAESGTDDVAETQEDGWTIRPSGTANATSIALTAPEGVDLAKFHLPARFSVRHDDLDAAGRYPLAGFLTNDAVRFERLGFPLGSVPVKQGFETLGKLGGLRIVGGGDVRLTSLLHRVGSWDSPEMYDRAPSFASSSRDLVLEPTPFSIKVTRSGTALGCLGDESKFYRDSLVKEHCPRILSGKMPVPAIGNYQVELTTRDRMGARVTTKQSVYVHVEEMVTVAIPGAVSSNLSFVAEPNDALRDTKSEAVAVRCTVPGKYSDDFVKPSRGMVPWEHLPLTWTVWALDGQAYDCEYEVSGSTGALQIVGGRHSSVGLRRIEVVDVEVDGAPRSGTFVLSQWRSGAWVKIGTHKTGIGLSVAPGKYQVVVSYVDDFGLSQTLPPFVKDLSN